MQVSKFKKVKFKNKTFETNLMSKVVASQNLILALKHVYKKRKKYNHNNDIWHLKYYWRKYKQDIQEKLLQGKYQFDPIKVKKGEDDKYYALWSAKDTVVLKALSIIIEKIFIEKRLGINVYHLSGKGGLKGAVRTVNKTISNYKYVVKSDVADFYSSVNHKKLKLICKKYIKDKRIIMLIMQYANRLEDILGEYKLITIGISRSCPLSPLMGALILKQLDDSIYKEYGYVRYMDDWVIFSNSKNKIRRIVKLMHKIMKDLKFKLAYDKTYIGKISKGFDFLGYKFNNSGLIGLADKTIMNFKEKVTKLYEQHALKIRISNYIKRWRSWAQSGLGGALIALPSQH